MKNRNNKINKRSMYSSRMSTGRLLTVWGGGEGLPNLEGLHPGRSAQPGGGGVWPTRRGMHLGVLPDPRGYASGGLHRGYLHGGGLPNLEGNLHPGMTAWGVCIQGGLPTPLPRSAYVGVGQTPLPLWTEWHTGVKTLPCPKLRLRTVIRINETPKENQWQIRTEIYPIISISIIQQITVTDPVAG